jgi:hypothetical protein
MAGGVSMTETSASAAKLKKYLLDKLIIFLPDCKLSLFAQERILRVLECYCAQSRAKFHPKFSQPARAGGTTIKTLAVQDDAHRRVARLMTGREPPRCVFQRNFG